MARDVGKEHIPYKSDGRAHRNQGHSVTSRLGMPTRFICACGGGLRWEMRESYPGQRWLGVCSRPECGEITTAIAEGEKPVDALRHFLLDQTPPMPYKPPWVRLFMRASRLGFHWRPHHDRCWNCGRDLVMALQLPPPHNLLGNPNQAVMCMDCGALEVSFWGADEPGAVIVSGEAWDEPAAPVRALTHALVDQANHRQERHTWDFESGR